MSRILLDFIEQKRSVRATQYRLPVYEKIRQLEAMLEADTLFRQSRQKRSLHSRKA
jgi:hypothetical protein